jgi:Ca2+-binding RTX toxin-like protein
VFPHRSLRLLLAIVVVALAVPLSGAVAKTSHAGWPDIDGVLKMNKTDGDAPLKGTASKHNELLGGHGNDTLVAGDAGDVLWGDYKPCCQPESQVDHIRGGAGNDFIYASHGANYIHTGGGVDVVHAHFGRGAIWCDSATVTVFLSHRSKRGYKLHGCRHISFKTLGY